jgi:hypothetical protein
MAKKARMVGSPFSLWWSSCRSRVSVLTTHQAGMQPSDGVLRGCALKIIAKDACVPSHLRGGGQEEMQRDYYY